MFITESFRFKIGFYHGQVAAGLERTIRNKNTSARMMIIVYFTDYFTGNQTSKTLWFLMQMLFVRTFIMSMYWLIAAVRSQNAECIQQNHFPLRF